MNGLAPQLSTAKPATLEEAALSFSAIPKFSVVLEQHRDAILTLRARGASITQIQDILRVYNILVSEWAIIRFCRKYRVESKRLQTDMDRSLSHRPSPKPVSSAPSAISTPAEISTLPAPSPTSNPTTSQSHKQRDMRGEF